jgi:hypothetical protein
MAQIEIPEPWRKQVCAILETEDGRLIEWTSDAERRYEADGTAAKMRGGNTDPVWRYEIYRPLRDFFASPNCTGCPVAMDRPPGETFEFFFTFAQEKFYGKVLLRSDRKRVVIFSAHRPLFATLSCE